MQPALETIAEHTIHAPHLSRKVLDRSISDHDLPVYATHSVLESLPDKEPVRWNPSRIGVHRPHLGPGAPAAFLGVYGVENRALHETQERLLEHIAIGSVDTGRDSTGLSLLQVTDTYGDPLARITFDSQPGPTPLDQKQNASGFHEYFGHLNVEDQLAVRYALPLVQNNASHLYWLERFTELLLADRQLCELELGDGGLQPPTLRITPGTNISLVASCKEGETPCGQSTMRTFTSTHELPYVDRDDFNRDLVYRMELAIRAPTVTSEQELNSFQSRVQEYMNTATADMHAH